MSHADRPSKARRDRPSRSSPSPRRRSDRRAPYPFELSVAPSPEPSAPASADEARRALDDALADLDRVFRDPRERGEPRESGRRARGDAGRDASSTADAGDADRDVGSVRGLERAGRAGAGAGPSPAPSAAAASSEPAGEVSLPVHAPAPLGEHRPGWRRVAYPLAAAAAVVGLIALLGPAGLEPGRADAVAGVRTAALTPASTLRGADPAGPERRDPAPSALGGFAAAALDDLAASALGGLAGVSGPEAPEVAPYWLSPAVDRAPERGPVPAAPALRLRLTEPSPAVLHAELSDVEEVAVAAVARPLEESAAIGPDEPGPAGREGAAAGGAARDPYDVLPRPRRLEAFRDRVAALAARAFRLGEDRVIELEATIGPAGRVEHLQTVKSTGVRDLDFAIMGLVRDMEFSPALRDGAPVEAVIRWPITLRGRDLEDEDADRR